MAETNTPPRLPWPVGRPTRRIAVIGFTVAAVVLVLLANLHFLYVAMQSQPGCVAHLKTADGEPGTYRAAKSAC